MFVSHLRCCLSINYVLELIKQLHATIKYFEQSGHAKTLLREHQEERSLGPGLESIGKTRFGTLLWSAVSVQCCIPGIQELSANEQIEITVCICNILVSLKVLTSVFLEI